MNSTQHSVSPVINNLFILSRNIDRSKHICKKIGMPAFNFITSFVDIQNPGNFFISQGNAFQINDSFKIKYNSVIDLNPVKKFNQKYQFIQFIDRCLVRNGLFIGRIESEPNNGNFKTPGIFHKLLYFMYFSLFKTKRSGNHKESTCDSTQNTNLRTKIDLFGRLYYYGYEVVTEKEIGQYLYFVIKKSGKQSENPVPTSCPIIKLNRIGKNGKIITIYKFRTMYPFSEYLQEYIFRANNIESCGKFRNDKRISRIGSFLRKYWIDEIPMFINLLKGDIKLFGVRPLSQQYFDLYTDELKQLRTKFKPGLIPPYYVDLPKNFDEILNSEQKYLQEYQKEPFITDIKYLFKAIYNILIRFKRSK